MPPLGPIYATSSNQWQCCPRNKPPGLWAMGCAVERQDTRVLDECMCALKAYVSLGGPTDAIVVRRSALPFARRRASSGTRNETVHASGRLGLDPRQAHTMYMLGAPPCEQLAGACASPNGATQSGVSAAGRIALYCDRMGPYPCCFVHVCAPVQNCTSFFCKHVSVSPRRVQ